MKLISYSDDWADEMSIGGFIVLTDAQWELFQEVVKVYFAEFKTWEFGIGTNQEIEYRAPIRLFNQLSIKEISEEEEKFFPNRSYGFNPVDQLFNVFVDAFEDDEVHRDLCLRVEKEYLDID